MDLFKRARSSGILTAGAMAAGVVILAATLLTTVTRLRMFELRDSLQSFNEKNDDLRNVTLLSRVSLINQSAFTGGGNRETAASYKQEAESALIAIRQSHAKDSQATFVDRAALPVLNAFNFVIGQPRLKLGKTPAQEIVLDLAFQFETYREYAKAVQSYDVYIGEFRLRSDEREFALLHRGFCRAMLNQFDAALADFDTVAKNATSKSAWIAQKLTAFLTELQAKIKFIESVADPAERGELYYNAAAYLKALENFAKIAKGAESQKIRFLRARALEETGRSTEALPIYRQLISEPGASQYAVNANRRMYLLGTFLGHDENLARESKKNSETVVRDKEFMTNITPLEKSAVTLHEEAIAERAVNKAELAAVQKLVKIEEPAKQEPVVPAPINPPVVAPVKPPPEVNLKNEKIAKQAENLAEKKKEQLIKKQAEKVDKLTMADGNVFYGVVYKEDADNVFLYSVLGNLELEKSNILKREKVAGHSALK